ncbi:MAG: caspase family protein [Deltaproteobacteria bacterium]
MEFIDRQRDGENAMNCFNKMGHLVFALIIVLSFGASSTAFADTRGISLKIKDTQGQEVGLYNESHALLIGVSNYTKGWPKLPGVGQDVTAIKTLLEKQGFNVVTVNDPDREALLKAFDSFIERHGYNPDDRLIIYFAGHGHTVKQAYGEEMGYIVPIDAPNPNTDRNGFLSKALDMQTVEVYAKRIQSKHVLFVFDSCFSGSIFALSRAVPESISYKTIKPVRQFITSGSAEEQVPDKSLFRDQLISALNGEADLNKDGYITGTELGEFLQDKVVNYSKGAQHPQYGKIRNPNLDKGDFVFKVASGFPSSAELKQPAKNRFKQDAETLVFPGNPTTPSPELSLTKHLSESMSKKQLILKDGDDVLIHDEVVELIQNYYPNQPVYVAYGEPSGCGPAGNVWMQNPRINVNKYVLTKEGNYFRAKNMVNLQFQVVQLNNNQAGGNNVRWAQIHLKANEIGVYYFNGFDCSGNQRTAIWVKK